MKVNLTKEINRKINSSSDVSEIMKKIFMRQNKLHRQKEYFWVIGLNTANRILYVEVVAIGSLNKIIIDPVEVFCFAVAKKCKRIIIVHNHPSGVVEPSPSDIELTAALLKGASYLGIELLDHIIITETDYLSLNDIGVFDSKKAKKE